MQISTRKQRTLSGVIGLLSATHETGRELRTVIGPLLLDLLDADFYASYAWNAQKQAFELGVSVNLDAACVRRTSAIFSTATRSGCRTGCSGASIPSARSFHTAS